MTDEADRLIRLRESLAERAWASGDVEVAWRSYDSPLGSLTLAATEVGLVRVGLASEPTDDVLGELAERVGPAVLWAPARLDRVAHELDEYFDRSRRKFDLALDWRLASGFRGEVQRALPSIGYGEVVTYAGLAEAAGRPKAFRAAASACATNPLPVVVPCHRVVRSDGRIGDYRGGHEAKRLLLDLEAA